MKILIVLHKANKIGGQVLQFKKMAREFKNQGHEVLVFSFDSIPKTRNIFYNIFSIFRGLKKQIKLFNPTHIFTSDPYITTSFALLTKKITTPIILRIGTKLQSFYASRIIEEISPEKIYVSLFYFIEYILKQCANILFKKIRLIVFNSYFLQKQYFNNSQNSIVIRNGVDMLNNGKLTNNNHLKLIYIGRIHPRKSIELIVNTLYILKKKKIDYHFSIIGNTAHNPNYWNKIAVLINKYQIQNNITVYNEIPNAELPQILITHDILLFPTNNKNYPITEGTPNVILEGMANGLAIIATNIDGVLEFLNEENGFLVEPDPYKFAQKIEFLTKNRDILSKIKAANIKEIKKNYSIKKTSQKYLRYFEAIESK